MSLLITNFQVSWPGVEPGEMNFVNFNDAVDENAEKTRVFQ